METREQQFWEAYIAEPGTENRDILLDYYTPWARQVYFRTVANIPEYKRDKDLWQVALISLWQSIEKYPYNSEILYSFKRFARMRIKGGILQEYKENGDISRAFVDKYLRIRENGKQITDTGWRTQALIAQAKGNYHLDSSDWECASDSKRVPDRILMKKEVTDELNKLVNKLTDKQIMALNLVFSAERGEADKPELDRTSLDRRNALSYLKMMLTEIGIDRVPRRHYPGIRLKASGPNKYHAYEAVSRKGGSYHYIGRFRTLRDALDAQKAYEEEA